MNFKSIISHNKTADGEYLICVCFTVCTDRFMRSVLVYSKTLLTIFEIHHDYSWHHFALTRIVS